MCSQVKMLWVFNAQQSKWEKELPTAVANLIKATRKADKSGGSTVTEAGPADDADAKAEAKAEAKGECRFTPATVDSANLFERMRIANQAQLPHCRNLKWI